MEIIFKTDLSISGTLISIDGVDITKQTDVTSIYISANGDYESKDWSCPGSVNVSISTNKDGVAERKSFSTCNSPSEGPIGSASEMIEDSLKDEKFKDMLAFRPIGRETIISDKETIINKIIEVASVKKFKIPNKDELSKRSIESLNDKLNDINELMD